MSYRFYRWGAVAALLTALGLPAVAQANTSESNWKLTSSITTSSYDSDKTLVFNVGRCKELFGISAGEASFVFTLDDASRLSSGAKFSLKFANGSETCASKQLDRASDDVCDNIANNQSLTSSTNPITVKLKVSELSSAQSADQCENLAETSYIYLIVSDSNSGIENIYTVSYALDFRTKRPNAPASLDAKAGGSSISLSWDEVSDAASYNVYYVTEGGSLSTGDAPENLSAKSISVSKNSATLKDNIKEETDYIIGVTAVDKNGNESLVGGVSSVTTVASNDFWDTYRKENEDVDGGFCFIATAAWGSTQEPHVAMLRQFRDNILLTNAPGRAFVDTYYKLSPPLAYFIGQHPLARSVTRALLWPVYGMAYLALNAPAALAGIFLLFCLGLALLVRRVIKKHNNNQPASATKTTAAALLIAAAAAAALTAAPSDAYALDADDESHVNMMFEFKAGPYTPDKLGNAYSKHFGDNSGYLIEAEYDYQFWRGVGSVGIGFHLAYGSVSGHAVDKTGENTVDDTTLHWLPLRLSLVYRFDYLWQRFNVPLILYAKAGFDYYIWFVKGADGISKDDEGNEAYGGTFGFHVNAGLAFVLDWLSPSMAKSFDVEWGVNNSYIFAEFLYADINNFYSGGAMDLTEQATFQIGIAIEF